MNENPIMAHFVDAVETGLYTEPGLAARWVQLIDEEYDWADDGLTVTRVHIREARKALAALAKGKK